MITSLTPDSQPRAEGLSNGIARGLAVDEAAAASGVTVFQFKQAVRQYSSQ